MVPNQYHITCGRIAHINFLNMEVIYIDKERGTWFCRFYYTEYIGEGKQKKKRGFATRKEASEWKRNFLIKEKQCSTMLFKAFAAVYLSDFTVNLRSMLCVSNCSSISAKCVSAINTLYYREKYSMPVCIFYGALNYRVGVGEL